MHCLSWAATLRARRQALEDAVDERATAPGSPYALAMIGHGTDPAVTIYVAPVDRMTGWRKVAADDDGVLEAVLHGADLYLLSRNQAPRFQVLRTSAESPQLERADVVVPPSMRVLGAIAASSETLYIGELDGGLGRLRRYDFATRNNPLRLETTADGPILEQEFGSTRTEAGFRALLAIDSTQAVRPNTRYPAVLLGASFNDARVPPWQPGKLAAHLQAATTSGRPVLLRVEFDAGHNMTSKSQLDRWVTDQLAFLYSQVGGLSRPPSPR